MSAGPVAALGEQVCEADTKVVPGGHVEQAGEPEKEYDREGHDSTADVFLVSSTTSVGESARE